MYSFKDKLNFIDCLIANMGNPSRAIADYNKKYTTPDMPPLVRQTHYTWLKEDKILDNGMTYRDMVDEVEMRMLDDAEFLLKNKAILQDNLRAITFYLKHRHPDYKQRFEIETGERKEADEAISKINQLYDDTFGTRNNTDGEPTSDKPTNSDGTDTGEEVSVSE